MDAFGSPNLTNLFYEVTGLIWSVHQTFGGPFSGIEVPVWICQLWTEIERLHVVLEQAERYGLGDEDFFSGNAVENYAFLIEPLSFVQEMKADITSFQSGEILFGDIRLLEKERCRRCIESVNSCRKFVARALSQTQSANFRGVVMIMQDNDTFRNVLSATEAMPGVSELVILGGSNDTAPVSRTLNTSQGHSAKQKGFVSKNSQWMTTSTRQFRTQGSDIRCSASCRCTCHSVLVRYVATRWMVKAQPSSPRVKGELGLTFRCRRLDCRMRSRGRGRTVVLHNSLLNRAIETSILLRVFQIKFRFRVQRIVSETSDIVKFARNGDFEAFEHHIRTGKATVFDVTDDGWTVLHTAAYMGCLEIADFLLDHGAPTDVVEVKMRKAAHFAKFKALRVGSTDREKALARRFADQDFRYEFELSPILTAVLQEYDDLDLERPSLRSLLDFAVLLSGVRSSEQWAVWRWRYRDRSPLYQELISFFESNYNESSPTSVLSNLLEWPDAIQMWTPLQWAAYVDRKDELVLLLQHGAQPYKCTPSGRNLIHHAAEAGTYNVLAYLLQERYHETGLDIDLHDLWGETPLHLATVNVPLGVELLLQHGAVVNTAQAEGLTPLHYTFIIVDESTQVDICCLLLNHPGCSVNVRDEIGRTPLMYLTNSPLCIELLLSYGADLALSDNEGKNIMHHASLDDKPQALALCLGPYRETGWALAAQSDIQGDTPLLLALRGLHRECAKILLSNGPVSKVADKDLNSLVHHATNLGDEEVLQLALSVSGMSLFMRNKNGDTVFDIIREKGYANHPIGEMIKRAARMDEAKFQQALYRAPPLAETHAFLR